MKAAWLSVGTALLLSQAAVAGHLTRSQRMQENGITQSQPSQSSQTSGPSQASQQSQSSQPSQSLAQQLRSNLQRSGYSNVTVMPGSFIVRAQIPQGNPMEMIVTPTSVAAVDVGRWSGNPERGRSVGAPTSPRFVRGPVYDAMNSNLADTNVQSSDDQNVGTIKGIAIGENGSLSYLLTVNGGRDVAVTPAAMSLRYDDSADKWNASVDATKKPMEVGAADSVQSKDAVNSAADANK